ncbi:MAG: ABC transporter substrate-binding protein [Actinobacteria bacterium]|nr:ABC transporter substrate-binding protein [Actinomycetota bacterium]
MTGDLSWRGQDAFEGADVSVHILNRNLRKNEPMFELVTIDDGGDPQKARAAVEQLAANGQTVGIVYAGPEDVLPDIEQFLASTKVPLLFNFGDLYSSQLLTPHLFQMAPAYLWEARVLARYLLRDRRYSRIGALTGESLSGSSARRSLQVAFGELGRSLVASEILSSEARPLRRALALFERRRVQAIVVEGGPDATETLLRTLEDRGSRYTTTKLARNAARPGAGSGVWAPQVVGFHTLISPAIDPDLVTEGLVAADTYARGAHYLPIPSFVEYRRAFNDWWGDEPAPIGWERRAYESVQLLGWAARRYPSNRDVDVAAVLQEVRRKRFGGLSVTFGPDDRTAADQATVGLWVVPARPVPEADVLPEALPWVPLARGFSIDGERTNVLNQDWKYLFRNAPPRNAPAPKFKKQKFGVTTRRSDPVH